MKIFRVTNDYIHTKMNRGATNWDDISDIPDLTEDFTDNKKEYKNPLCSNFWQYQIRNDKKFLIDNVSDLYKEISEINNKYFLS